MFRKFIRIGRTAKVLIKQNIEIIKHYGFNVVNIFKYTQLFFRKQLQAEEFIRYNKFLGDKEFMSNFLSFSEADYYWRVLNNNKYASLARDKFITHLLLEKAHISKSELYAYYSPESSDSTNDIGYDYESIRDILKSKNVTQCVVKPSADSAHGEGVFICNNIKYELNDCLLEKSDGTTISLKELLSRTKNALLFESKIKQTEQVSAFCPSSVNTVRFMTALYPSGEVKIITTFMKIGRLGSDVDNAGSGGNVDCAINAEGCCHRAIKFNSFQDIQQIDKHPDTQAPINGVVIDNWSDICNKIKDFQARIPFIKAIGWDVAITNDGPIVIEINNWWDTTGQIFIGHGWRNEIIDCYKAWTNYYKSN